MIIAIGSDHAGFVLKEHLRGWLVEQGHDVIDLGAYSSDRVDYPHFGAEVGRTVASGKAAFGVAVCGSGQGICMAANKVPGVRAGIIRDTQDAAMTRQHNNANVACFGERVTDPDVAVGALKVFLETAFEGGRHEARVEQLAELDAGQAI
ncbi:MAG: ribose 5-phosphate isomerase B [Candidatus Nanopelagicales bacterium]|nr:ribose 5-phosphate isomerase B [Candidatus Nanopelagicales bacterium]MDD2819042.1 ribose 5-phosphate isomerase B [Candidatus Nanopelagicales bacterium]